MIKFSIAIAAYKSLFLKECIGSVIDQTFKNFELIIINDCSPEPVEEIVKGFVDSRINYTKNLQNTGAEDLVKTWNKCLSMASGDYFIMLGDDDKLEPDYLEEFVKLINKYPNLDVFHCRSRIIDENSNSIYLTQSWPEYESVYDNIFHRLSGHRLQFISDFVYRTSTLRKNSGFFYLPLAWGSDDISAYIACGLKGIAHTNKPIFNYRQTRYTIFSTGDQELKMKAIIVYEEWISQFLFKEPKNELDAIIRIQLMKIKEKEFKRRKVDAINKSLRENILQNIVKWSLLRNKYKISLAILSIGILKNLKSTFIKL